MISQPTLAVPIEFAEAYFENRLHADAWTSASVWLLKLDPTDYPAALTQGLASGSAGAVSASFSKDMVAPLVCPTAVSLVGVLGVLNEPENGTIRSTMLEG